MVKATAIICKVVKGLSALICVLGQGGGRQGCQGYMVWGSGNVRWACSGGVEVGD